jgi:hypothetical protein
MKKFLAMAILAIASLGASAEGLYVGGSLGYWHSGDDNTNHLTILPEIGYNLSSNWAVGTTIGYDYTHFCGQGISGNTFQFNPYARYTYFKSSNNLVNLFVDGTVGLGLGWASYEDEDSKTACTWQIGVAPGIAINLTQKFSLVAHIGFLGYKGANHTAETIGYYNEGGLKLDGNDIKLGFYYNF